MKGTDTMRNNSKYLIILLIVLLGIGFAFLSSDSNILGMSIASKQKWSIYFNNPTKVGGNVDASQLELKDSTTIEFTVDLLKPGDFYEFTVEVINDGTIDGMINTMRATELNSDQNKLFEYVITYEDGSSLKEKQLLIHGTSDKYKVVLRYKDDITANDLLENNQSVSIEFSVEYVQADDTSFDRIKNSFVSVYNQATIGELNVGDEINIGDEHFYIISEDTNKYTLLAKYNLNVGDYKVDGIEGIQNKKSVGTLINKHGFGSVYFSNSGYWRDSSGNITNPEKYKCSSLSELCELYDEDYSDASGKNYSVAYYVIEYVKKMEQNGAIIINRRLLTLDEAYSLKNSGNTDLLFKTNYWLGSGGVSVFRVRADNRIYPSNDNSGLGVRPVIEVSKQYL